MSIGLAFAACATGKAVTRAEPARSEAFEQLVQALPVKGTQLSTVDINGDKKPDVWNYTVPATDKHGKPRQRLVRKELDLNWDGKVDLVRVYADDESIREEIFDLDFDGKPDQVTQYENGVVVKKSRDLSNTGRPSQWSYYENGKLVRKERDTNADGKVDYWEYWSGGKLERIGEDLDFDGKVDKWTTAGAEEVQEKKEQPAN